MTSFQPPLITIITVTYNAADALEETIKSIINSKYPNLNYYIVDGGSNDSTIDIIGRYSTIITAYTSEPDKGIYDAMNKGWAWACEESYILFLGAGDRIVKLPKPEHDYNKVYFGNVLKGDYLFKSVHNFKLTLGSTLHHQALLIPKKLNPQPPFNLEYRLYADFDFNQRLKVKKVTFIKCEDFLVYALPGGASAKRSNTEMLTIVEKNFGRSRVMIARLYYAAQKIKQILYR